MGVLIALGLALLGCGVALGYALNGGHGAQVSRRDAEGCFYLAVLLVCLVWLVAASAPSWAFALLVAVSVGWKMSA